MRFVYLALVLMVLVGIQGLLVHLGEPSATWLWCDMAGLCG